MVPVASCHAKGSALLLDKCTYLHAAVVNGQDHLLEDVNAPPSRPQNYDSFEYLTHWVAVFVANNAKKSVLGGIVPSTRVSR